MAIKKSTPRNRIYVTAQPSGYLEEPRSIRVALDPEAAIEINDPEWGTGIRMDRCWFGRRRLITQSYSIWDDGRGRCRGTQYTVIEDISEILEFCRQADIEPPAWIEAEEA